MTGIKRILRHGTLLRCVKQHGVTLVDGQTSSNIAVGDVALVQRGTKGPNQWYNSDIAMVFIATQRQIWWPPIWADEGDVDDAYIRDRTAAFIENHYEVVEEPSDGD